MGMVSEFKDFAMKGNLIDMAVGVVMGAAFGKVSGAFIDGMFMPIIGKLFQVGDLSKYNVELSSAVTDAAGKVTTPASAIAVGDFISALLNFLIVAFIMFMVIKSINNLKKAEAAAPPAPAPTPANEVLLGEIRDLLKR